MWSINVNLRPLVLPVVVGWGGVQSHFCVQPNYSVEDVLRCDVVGVVSLAQ